MGKVKVRDVGGKDGDRTKVGVRKVGVSKTLPIYGSTAAPYAAKVQFDKII